MSHLFRRIVLAAVVLSLALAINPASAQIPENPAVTACVSGSGNAPGCDVGQNDSGHNHFGETWSGATPAVGLYVQHTATSGFNAALFGQTASTSGTGVRGRASATTGTNYGVFGEHFSDSGAAVFGLASSIDSSAAGVRGVSNGIYGTGVYGRSNGTWGIGVYGVASKESRDRNIGVAGYANGGDGVGVYGEASDTGVEGLKVGVFGWVSGPYAQGVRGVNAYSGGTAGYFVGNVKVMGNLSKLGGSFKIDHPLDPANKYLSHSFVESPDMMNIYNGNVVLDEKGEAWVELADWFEALNQDFRYQLTPIGGWAPLYIAEKIQGNRFKIAGGEPGLEVSWQVTGIRHDVWAEQNRIRVEEDKPGEEKGLYLYPRGYGRPDTEMVDYLPPTARMDTEMVDQPPLPTTEANSQP